MIEDLNYIDLESSKPSFNEMWLHQCNIKLFFYEDEGPILTKFLRYLRLRLNILVCTIQSTL